MQEENNRFQPLCIWRRLFDFIVNNLVARGRGGFNFKSVAFDHHHPLPQSSSNKAPDCSRSCLGINNNGVANSSSEEHLLVQPKPNHEQINMVEDHDLHDWADFEIQVHHKMTDNLEYWTPVDSLGSSIYPSDHKDSTISSIALDEVIPEKAQLRHEERAKATSAAQGKDMKEVETATFAAMPTGTTTRTRSSGTKKMMSSIKDLARGEKSSGKKQGKNNIIMSEKLTLAVEADMETNKAPVRQVRPLFNVAMSINEKSDAFIRSRKAAMRGSYDFDTNQTS